MAGKATAVAADPSLEVYGSFFQLSGVAKVTTGDVIKIASTCWNGEICYFICEKQLPSDT